MQVEFKIGKVIKDKDTHGLADRLAAVLPDLRYSGIVTEANSNQLKMNFDEQLRATLERKGWKWDEPRKVESLDEDWGNQKPDAILTHNSSRQKSAVLEIEKSNKKTLWFDFIKLWMFIESGQASEGIVLCPLNYAHKHGVWDLYDYTCLCKRYLGRFAGVTKEKLALIAPLGFEQLIESNGKTQHWGKEEFNRVKEESRRR